MMTLSVKDTSDKLPSENAPAILGLHKNANILYNIENADYICQSLRKGPALDKGIWDFYAYSYLKKK